MDPGRVVLAEISRPRGTRGEVLAVSQTDVPGRLEQLKRAWIRLADESDIEVELSEAWEHKGNWVLKFSGVDSIQEADRLRGSDLWVPVEQRAQLPDGELFRSDLIGCAVIDKSSGRVLGQVQGFQQYGGPLLLEVMVDGREALIPFVAVICTDVDLENKAIGVALPEGLLEL